MRFRLRLWLLTLGILAGCALIVALVHWVRTARDSSLQKLIGRLPADDAVLLYIDVAALRQAGLLNLIAGPADNEESEYREFVRDSGFDYTRDLDSVLASFSGPDAFFFLRGRFDWSRLVDYVQLRGGSCFNGFCRVRGSAPRRRISFFAVTRSIMALASSSEPWAAAVLQRNNGSPPGPDIPAEPFWITLSGQTLSRASWLPAAMRPFATALADAEGVTLAVGPAGQALEARLRVVCPSSPRAQALAADLNRVTELLRSLVAGEGKASDPRDLKAILAGGRFHADLRQVSGRWPIPAEFLAALAAPASP